MLKVFEFGHEVFAYIRSRLSNGTALSGILLHSPLERGRVFAYLPDAVDPSKLTSFNHGGVVTDSEDARQVNGILVDFISRELAASARQYAIFGDLMHSPGSSFLTDVLHFAYRSEAHLFVSSDSNDRELIRIAIRKAGQYPFIGFLTEIGDIPPIADGSEISTETAQLLAKNTRHLIVGAYDEEAYLIWGRLAGDPPA